MTIDDFTPLILNAGKASLNSNWNYSNVKSPFARLFCVIEGSATISLGGVCHNLTAGHLYLIPPFTQHSTSCDGKFVHYYIHTYEDIPAESGSIFDEWDFPFEVPATETDIALIAQLVQNNPELRLKEFDPEKYDNHQNLMNNLYQEKERDISTRIECKAIVMLLISHFLGKARHHNDVKDKRIRQSIKVINSRLSKTDLRIDELKAAACLSTNQFIRLFKKETGQTPLQYITNKRIEKAQALLLKSEINTKNLANAVGFEDSAYFCKVFKKSTGFTPQKYRQQALNPGKLPPDNEK